MSKVNDATDYFSIRTYVHARYEGDAQEIARRFQELLNDHGTVEVHTIKPYGKFPDHFEVSYLVGTKRFDKAGFFVMAAALVGTKPTQINKNELLLDENTGSSFAIPELTWVHIEYLPRDVITSAIPFLTHPDPEIRHTTLYDMEFYYQPVVPIFDVLFALTEDPHAEIREAALDAIFMSSSEIPPEQFHHITDRLADDGFYVRQNAMRMVFLGQIPQWKAAREHYIEQAGDDSTHVRGLDALIQVYDVPLGIVYAMIDDADRLVRTYGAIAAGKYQSHDLRAA